MRHDWILTGLVWLGWDLTVQNYRYHVATLNNLRLQYTFISCYRWHPLFVNVTSITFRHERFGIISFLPNPSVYESIRHHFSRNEIIPPSGTQHMLSLSPKPQCLWLYPSSIYQERYHAVIRIAVVSPSTSQTLVFWLFSIISLAGTEKILSPSGTLQSGDSIVSLIHQPST